MVTSMTRYSNKNDFRKGDPVNQIFNVVIESINSMDFSGLSLKIRDAVAQTTSDLFRQTGKMPDKDYTYGKGSGKAPYTVDLSGKSLSSLLGRQEKKLPGTYSGPLQVAAGGTGLAIFGGSSLGSGLEEAC